VVFIHSLAALVSVFQALLGIETSVIARGVTFSQGFLGRLYGVYMGPGESNSVICIALIIFFVGKWDKWYQKLYYIFCIGITYYSFLLENARACELAFLATSAGVAWIISRKYLYKTKGKGIVKEGIAIILTVLCVTSVYFINYGCRSLAYNTVGSLSEDQEDSEDQKVLNREIMQRDIRLDIWKAYITAFSKDRSLLGYNKSGYESYLKESYPECFSGVERFSTHSSYVDTLCRIGWVGFALLLLWIGYHMAGCLRYVIKRISLRKEEVGMIAVVIIMLTVGVFGEITFWTFTYTDVMIFWLIAGKLTLELQEWKRE
jgi:O-antigen ligase